MATTLTISTPVTTTLTIDGVTTTYNISGTETVLEISSTIATQLAASINYTPSGRMAATTVQGALDEIAGDFWYDTDDDELKVYRGTTWQTLAGAGGDAETMLTLDGGSF